MAKPSSSGARPTDAAEPRPASRPEETDSPKRAPMPARGGSHESSAGKDEASKRDLAPEVPKQAGVLYSGVPSWRAFFKEFAYIGLFTILMPLVTNFFASNLGASGFTHFLAVAIPLVIGVGAGFIMNLYRRSLKFRISKSTIESESGILVKKIEVLELWRCRDIRYRQSVIDRILQVAHIDVFTADVTTPQLQLLGLPASRKLFSELRDSIQIERQAHNVYAVVE